MTNDNAIVRLLYAILKQKCLKDIDWNKVAHDDILQQEITNGHAARMRYSRFKKQMDGTAGVRKPRKTKVEKNNKSLKKERVKQQRRDSNDQDDDAAGKIKEEVGVAGSSHHSLHTPVDGTPEALSMATPDMDGSFHGGGSSVKGSPFIKREPGSSGGSRYATTPLEESSATTPGSSLYGGAGAGERDDIESFATSFDHYNHQAYDGAYSPMMSHGLMVPRQYAMGGSPVAMDESYHVWDMQQPQQIEAEGGVLVKRESRWEPTYGQH